MKRTNKRFHKMSSAIVASTLLATGLLQSAIPAAASASLNDTIPAADASAKPEINLFEEFYDEWKSSLSQPTQPPASSSDVYISPDIDMSSSKPVSVIVQLSGQPAAVGIYAASKGYTALAAEATTAAVQTEQAAFLKNAKSSGLSLDVGLRFNQVLNGMAVTLTGNRISDLAKLPGVKAIFPNLTYTAQPEEQSDVAEEDPRIDMVPLHQLGVDEAWAEGYTGKGLKVGVIDTGIDYLHPDLAGAYKGGYDSYYGDDDPYEDILIPGVAPGTQHGTHVSGTIAGRAANEDGVHLQKGIAYESDLYVYKVLGGLLGTGSSAMIVDGIEHAVKDGMDVINLSLGDDGTKDTNSAEAIAINNAALAGVIPVLAAGNSGQDAPYYYSLGAPSTAELGITVGAATSKIDTYETVAASSTPNQSYSLRAMAWEPGQTDFAQLLGTDPLEVVYLGLGNDERYEDKDVAGKIVLVSRTHSASMITFSDKIEYAKKHGAKAVIIFNGTSYSDKYLETDPYKLIDLSESIPGRDSFIGYMGFQGESSDFIPTFDMKGAEGRALARSMMEHPDEPVTLTFNKPFTSYTLPGDTITSFSSRGPNNDGRFGIKPDVVAPGHRIESTVPAYGKTNPDADYDDAYERYSGTSMATPHIAGLSLLLKEKYPNWTTSDVRAALANTSDPLSDEEGVLYDAYSQGAGRANIVNALHTPALLKSLDEITIYDKKMNKITLPSEASSVAFGIIDPAVKDTATNPLQLKSVAGQAVTYTAKVELHDEYTNTPGLTTTPDWDGVSVELTGLDSGGKVSVAANRTRGFGLTVKADPDAKQGVYAGDIVLESPGVPTLHMPFVFNIGKQAIENENPFSEISVSNRIVKSDAPIDITLKYNGGLFNIMQLGVLDNNGTYYGLLANVQSSKDGEEQAIPKGEYVIEDFDGSYLGGAQKDGISGVFELPMLPDGQYTLSAATELVVFGHPLDVHFTNITINVDNVEEPETPPKHGDTGGSEAPPTTAPAPSETSTAVTASVVKASQTPTSLDAKTSNSGGVLTATVDDADLGKALEGAKGPSAIIVGVSSAESHEAELKFTASQVQSLKAAPAGSSVVFSWNGASVALPLSALSSVSEGAGLVIRVKEDGGSTKLFEASYPDAKVIGTPVAFEANIVKDNQETPVPLSASETVTRSFLIDGAVDVTTAGALYEEHGTVHPAPATFTASKNGGTIVIITRPGFSTYAVAERDIAFTDIGASWAKNDIQKLADKFIMNGTTAGTFAPKSNVTRAQFASMLSRALGLPSSDKSAPFKDVGEKDWFADDVAAAYEAGLVTGFDGSFKPNAEISRQELAVMLNRALQLLDVKSKASSGINFEDAVTFGAYAVDDIQAVTDAGLMNGVATNGSYAFRPAEATTRETAAKVLYQLLIAAKLIN
ncbi:S8 family serine peptidase [Cohnella sp. AR92]|uniref:S8 family serine peptidase n=1 Tax=Cohnella sp. AR92 TaxID=648716 RepID=UPI0013152337|nr:S8 family serine peptidase [Cohnella sp. AR92]